MQVSSPDTGNFNDLNILTNGNIMVRCIPALSYPLAWIDGAIFNESLCSPWNGIIYVASGHIREIEELNFTDGLGSKQPPIAKFSNFNQAHSHMFNSVERSQSNFWQEAISMTAS
jgi:hypothetical protein